MIRMTIDYVFDRQVYEVLIFYNGLCGGFGWELLRTSCLILRLVEWVVLDGR